MEKKSLKKTITDLKNKTNDSLFFKQEKYYQEINLRSFNKSFDVLIHHYKKSPAPKKSEKQPAQ